MGNYFYYRTYQVEKDLEEYPDIGLVATYALDKNHLVFDANTIYIKSHHKLWQKTREQIQDDIKDLDEEIQSKIRDDVIP
jgi:hypothetical protein